MISYKFRNFRDNLILNRVVLNSSWNLFGNAISQLLSLVILIFITRGLGVSGSGKFGIVYSTLITLSVFTGLGLGLSATKYVSENRNIDQIKTSRIVIGTSLLNLLANILACIILFVFSSKISFILFSTYELQGNFRYSIFLILFASFSNHQISILSGFESFKTNSIINLFKGIIVFIIVFLNSKYLTFEKIIFGYYFSNVISIIIAQIQINKKITYDSQTVNFDHLFLEIKNLYKFSTFSLINSLLWPLIVWISNLLLVRVPNGFTYMSVLNIIRQWQAAVNFIPVALNSAILPIFSNVFTETPEKLRSALVFSNKINLFSVWVVTLFLIIFSKKILAFYGPSYSSYYIEFIIIIVATAISLLNSPAGSLILSRGFIKEAILINIYGNVLYLIILYFTVYNFTLFSIGFSTLISNLLATILIVKYAFKKLSLPQEVKSHINISLFILVLILFIIFMLNFK